VLRVHGREASPSISKVLEQEAIAKTADIVRALEAAKQGFGSN